jgi:hypothetical protein
MAPPAAPTQPRLRKAFARAAEPTLRAWRQRERRRIVIIAAAATLAVAGVIVGRGPAPSAVTPAAPPGGTVAAPLPETPWLTAPVAVPPPSTPSAARAAASSASPTVRIKLTTHPAGAEVTVEGELTPRGTTPLVLTLARGNDVRRVILTAPGYQRALAEVTPDVDSRLHFELERAPTHALRHRASPRKLKPSAATDDDLDALFPAGVTADRGIRDQP